jgi:hypothetical protein
VKLWLRATVLALVSLTWLPACPKPDVLQLRSLTSQSATARVLNVARRHERMAGVVKARLPGMQGMIVSADLDVALEPEARVSVAVRSFFDQPMQMLVTDGSTVTVFDATQGAPVFLRGPVSDRTLSRVLPLPLWPRELVEIMLARPPLDSRGRLMGVNEEAGTYEVRLESFGHGPIELVVRGQDDAILEWTQFKRDGRRLLHARYQDHRMVGEVALAQKWTLTRLDTPPGDPMGQAIEVIALDLEHNGKPFDDAAFQLDPPPGTPLGAL